MKYSVKEYIDELGNSPFRSWIESLDNAVRARVQARIFRYWKKYLGWK